MINFDKIIISLEVYNFHLFITYFSGIVDVVKFDNFQSAFHKVNIRNLNYIDEIKNTNGNIEELGFIKNKLVAISDSKLITQNLFDEFDQKILLEENNFEQLYINQDSHKIDLLTTNNNLISVNTISFDERKNYNKYLKLDNNLTVSNLKSVSDNIYISIRGYGAKEINKEKTISFRSEDAQDIEVLSKNKIIIIADAFQGLLIFDLLENKKAIRKVRFENDIIQEIRLYQKMLLLKGKNGLYIYDYTFDKKYQIFEGSVGAFTSYYDMIFFTNSNKVNMITKDNTSVQHFKLIKDKLDIKIEKIKKYS